MSKVTYGKWDKCLKRFSTPSIRMAGIGIKARNHLTPLHYARILAA